MIGKTDFKMKPEKQIVSERELETQGRVQQFIDSEVMRLSDRYVPLDISAGAMGGTLKRSVIRNTKVGSGLVKWKTPYARRLYYNPQYNFQGKNNSPARGGLWFERMKGDHKKNILKGAKKIAGGK